MHLNSATMFTMCYREVDEDVARQSLHRTDLSLQFAVCDEVVSNSLYFSIYSGCSYGNTADAVVPTNVTDWSIDQLVQNCSLPCLPSFHREFVAFTRVPAGALLVGAVGMLIYSRRQRVNGKLNTQQNSSGSQSTIRAKKPLMQLVHRRIVIVSNMVVMAMTGLSEFLPYSRGAILPWYNINLSLLGHPERCVFGVPSAQQRMNDYRKYYWLTAVFIVLHATIISVSALFVAHYVYWRSKSVKQILNENKEVRNSMSGLVILQPWIASLLCLSIIGYVSLPIFDFTEPKQGDNCLPYLIQNMYIIAFVVSSGYSAFNIISNFTLLSHLKRKEVGETSVAAQTTLKRFVKDLVFFSGSLPAFFVVIRSSTATQLSWDAPYFLSRLCYFAVWFAHATIAKKKRIRVLKRSDVSYRGVQLKIPNQLANLQGTSDPKNMECSSVGGLSFADECYNQKGIRNPKNEECSSVGGLSLAYET